jgi:hypothetical protein
MLSKNTFLKQDAYAFVNGMKNVVYLAGYVRKLSKLGNGDTQFYVQQVNNLNLSLPVIIDRKDKIPQEVQEFAQVKVIGHVFGERNTAGDMIAVVKVLFVDTPNLLEMPGLAAWDTRLPDGVVKDNFSPTDLSANLEPAANVVEMAGFVEATFHPIKGEREQYDCLVILVRHKNDKDSQIPVRLYGKSAAAYKRRIQIGMPIYVRGIYRVRVKVLEKAPSGGEDKIEIQPYIHTVDIKIAVQGKHIKTTPQWAIERMKELVMLAQGDVAKTDAKKAIKAKKIVALAATEADL